MQSLHFTKKFTNPVVLSMRTV